ncbi:hypothetical protein HOLleu_26181 [Holothuria leucospilota]|uniref:Retroviral polymerase SH3-like domain-containing protein n=1 Tax=Holothuria leucospilota TaxID=206669 RepID=A0A9Q1BU41_HOLLE|nr:hypothetical protein HOLleu_26181 [Holothuria leucospilota]
MEQWKGTGERCSKWGRCLLIESGLPKTLWPYAVQIAVHIRNRCYNNRVKQTPYYMRTVRKPNLSKMWIFGSDCYAYKHNQRKLDPRCEKGIFVGYDKNSPAYLIYYPVSGKVIKHRLVKFIRKDSVAQQTQTDETWFDKADMYLKQHTCVKRQIQGRQVFPRAKLRWIILKMK